MLPDSDSLPASPARYREAILAKCREPWTETTEFDAAICGGAVRHLGTTAMPRLTARRPNLRTLLGIAAAFARHHGSSLTAVSPEQAINRQLRRFPRVLPPPHPNTSYPLFPFLRDCDTALAASALASTS